MDTNAKIYCPSNCSWHDDSLYLTQRIKMIQRIFVHFRGKEPSSPEYIEQLLHLAKQLELELYQSAPSFEAYLDMFTESGIQHLAVRVAMEMWPSCAQLVKAALDSMNDLKAVSFHEVIQQDKGDALLKLHRKMDDAQVTLLKIQVKTLEAEKAMAITEIEANNSEITSLSNEIETLKLERDQLQSRELLLRDKEEALEQLLLLKQQSDAEIEYLKLQMLTMRAENTTLTSQKAKAVNEATSAALESKSLFEDVQTLNSKLENLYVETQSMNLHIKAMEKDVVESFLKDRKIKALAEKVEALTVRKDAYDARECRWGPKV